MPMKAAVVKGNSSIEIKNIEKQSLGPGDILVQMHACGICGSDVEKVFGKYGQPSMRLGHEPAGIITQVGSEISNFCVGDRVVTHHHVACYSDDCHECSHGNETMCKKYYESNLEPCGLADEYVVPEWNVKHGGVLNIPDSMSFEEAAMIEPLACCIRAWSKFTHHKNDSVAILGVGPTGIMHVLLAKLYGLGKVFCLDLNDFRLNFAKKFETTTIHSGNTNALEQINSETANLGVDVVMRPNRAYPGMIVSGTIGEGTVEVIEELLTRGKDSLEVFNVNSKEFLFGKALGDISMEGIGTIVAIIYNDGRVDPNPKGNANITDARKIIIMIENMNEKSYSEIQKSIDHIFSKY